MTSTARTAYLMSTRDGSASITVKLTDIVGADVSSGFFFEKNIMTYLKSCFCGAKIKYNVNQYYN